MKKGDKIKFGRYDWLVLDVQDNKALIISNKVIHKRAFHDGGSILWVQSQIRSSLHDIFNYGRSVYDWGFSDAEKSLIIETIVNNADNPWSNRPAGFSNTDNTHDSIFLLSVEETIKYFGDSGQVRNMPKNTSLINDQYNSVRKAQDFEGTDSCWWLRSLGCYNGGTVAFINTDGAIDMFGSNVVFSKHGIRPALWLRT